MDRPIRVAQVIGMAINGGTESLWMNYYRHIDKNKVQFDFLVESESKIINKTEIEALGGHVIIIPSYKNPFKYMRTLKRIFKENNYDIVHSNMNALSVFTLRAAKKAGVKVRIAHSHSTSNKKEWKRNILKNVLRPFSKVYATHYFACSEHAGRWLFGNKSYDSNEVSIINNAIDIDRFIYNKELREKTRSELGIKDEFVIGHVGRFMTQKNHEFLVDIFNEFQKMEKNTKLLLVGDGPLVNLVLKKINELGISDKVIIKEPQKDIEKYYCLMDCFVFPSLYEGLGMTFVEAQVSGLHCLGSTEIPLEAKIVDDTVLFDLQEPSHKWANQILKFMHKERTECSLKVTKFDIKVQSVELVELYKLILEKSVEEKE